MSWSLVTQCVAAMVPSPLGPVKFGVTSKKIPAAPEKAFFGL